MENLVWSAAFDCRGMMPYMNESVSVSARVEANSRKVFIVLVIPSLQKLSYIDVS